MVIGSDNRWPGWQENKAGGNIDENVDLKCILSHRCVYIIYVFISFVFYLYHLLFYIVLYLYLLNVYARIEIDKPFLTLYLYPPILTSTINSYFYLHIITFTHISPPTPRDSSRRVASIGVVRSLL